MDPRLDIGVELPPVPVGEGPFGRVSLEPWWRLVLTSVEAGASVIWFTGGLASDVPSSDVPAVIDPFSGTDAAVPPLSRSLSCDACTLAAAVIPLLPHVDDALLGVVSRLPVDRKPAVLIRDVTTLDVLSAGRAAVALRWSCEVPGVPGRGHPTACTYLGEAIAVSRAMLRDEDPAFEGRYLRIAGAVNQPPPYRKGGLPLLVEVPHGMGVLVGRDPGASFLFREAVWGATAIICSDDPREVAIWRAQLTEAFGTSIESSGMGRVPRIICRTSLEDGALFTSRGNVCSRVEAAHAAGADGLVVRLPAASAESRRRAGGAADVADAADAAQVERVLESLASCFDLWRH
jgi:hypothetical protein